MRLTACCNAISRGPRQYSGCHDSSTCQSVKHTRMARYSCGALIELQQSTEAFLTSDATGMLREQRNRGRQEQLIAFALVRAFEMIMCNELSYCPAQGRFTKE